MFPLSALIVTDDDIVLVAPDTREVVELIEKDLSRPDGSRHSGAQGGSIVDDHKKNLSHKLDASGGIIKPPPGVDPQIVKPAPVPEPNSTPVIPPPGMPGGPPGPEPK
ncbi:MAG: hypothetical protein CR217_08035 [Beijerinckiaceae bacterium]|nr:MAG: hypothetical protein CR217_08035 [Beijerinckiaceae bacterium]